ncbi:MAG: QueT transporter family protein [Lachnospiraceae bacterium]|nr:QueT transporter family protein [Lachnospiraceae bacterium]MBQ8632931.1 QueT transporter family protein [Lachnospiraceae bacterium]
MKKHSNIMSLVTAAMIAALYVVLSFAIRLLGLDSGAIQVRVSEALTILPYFTASAIPGLTIGCLLFNLLSGAAVLDVIFGTLATLAGAVGSSFIGKAAKKVSWMKYLVAVPPILANAFIVPWILKTAYGLSDAYWYLVATVGIGEIISCGVLGMMLMTALMPIRNVLFKEQ